MKIWTTTTATTTEIECTGEELRQSNTLSEGFTNIFRRAFNGPLQSDFNYEGENDGDMHMGEDQGEISD